MTRSDRSLSLLPIVHSRRQAWKFVRSQCETFPSVEIFPFGTDEKQVSLGFEPGTTDSSLVPGDLAHETRLAGFPQLADSPYVRVRWIFVVEGSAPTFSRLKPNREDASGRWEGEGQKGLEVVSIASARDRWCLPRVRQRSP